MSIPIYLVFLSAGANRTGFLVGFYLRYGPVLRVQAPNPHLSESDANDRGKGAAEY